MIIITQNKKEFLKRRKIAFPRTMLIKNFTLKFKLPNLTKKGYDEFNKLSQSNRFLASLKKNSSENQIPHISLFKKEILDQYHKPGQLFFSFFFKKRCYGNSKPLYWCLFHVFAFFLKQNYGDEYFGLFLFFSLRLAICCLIVPGWKCCTVAQCFPNATT